jgi:hypothetical protein
MAKIKIEDCVVENKTTGLFDFHCPATDGSCGVPELDKDGNIKTFNGWYSVGWPLEAAAKARGKQHWEEHRNGKANGGGGLMQDMPDFIIDNKVRALQGPPTAADEGRVSPKDFL